MNYTENAQQAFNALNETYYRGGGVYKGTMFWDHAEFIEMIEDFCDRADCSKKSQLKECVDRLLTNCSEDWSSNKYYDDILWMCLALIRAADILDNAEYLNIAKSNFDFVTANGTTPLGLIEWQEGAEQSSAISSLTYVVCASLIAKAFNDVSYFTLGKNVMNKVMKLLYNPDNGHVYDHINRDGSVEYFEHVSNAGMFLRACSEMYDHTGDDSYINELDKAASYIIAKKYNSEIMCEHESGDGAGFKAILARQLRYVADKHNFDEYTEWLRCSADTAWANRNKYNLMQNDFCKKTADHKMFRAFDCHSAVVLLINCI
jgi:predicted alpha-1,6-mannanase (GH76 family)